MNSLASRESPIQLLVYQINAWFQMNIAGNRSSKLISIAYIITLTVLNFLSLKLFISLSTGCLFGEKIERKGKRNRGESV